MGDGGMGLQAGRVGSGQQADATVAAHLGPAWQGGSRHGLVGTVVEAGRAAQGRPAGSRMPSVYWNGSGLGRWSVLKPQRAIVVSRASACKWSSPWG